MYQSPSDNTLVKKSISPQAVGNGATVNGTGVNCAGYENALADIEFGATAAGTMTVKLQKSSDDGVTDAYADITGATTGAIAAAGQNKPHLIEVNLSECKPYIRAVATDAGGGGNNVVSAALHLSGGRHLPPTQDVAVVRV